MIVGIKKYLLYFLILVYVSGAIGFVMSPTMFSPFTPFTLLLTCLVFLIYQPINRSIYILSFAGLALIGFVSEVIGLKTGLVFGNYYYGDTLGYKIYEVPLTICLNWAMLINCGILISSHFLKDKLKVVFFAAVITTGVDLLIEQLASPIGFWHFEGGLAGLHNYCGWFIISFLGGFIFYNNLLHGDKKVAAIIIVLQLFFFGFIYLFRIFNFI